MNKELLVKAFTLLALYTAALGASAVSTDLSVGGMPTLDEALNVPGGTLRLYHNKFLVRLP